LQIIAFLLLAVALSHSGIKLRAVPRQARHDRAHAEGMRQFYAQGIDKTNHRTGVLIFASAAERYGAVTADSGINKKFSPHVLAETLHVLVSAIKDGRPGDGFVVAIE
jgi:putative membrane protein